jgi:hypothetical protein
MAASTKNIGDLAQSTPRSQTKEIQILSLGELSTLLRTHLVREMFKHEERNGS